MSAMVNKQNEELFGPNPALEADFRPAGYEDIKALAGGLKRNLADLIVMGRNNDPFFCGTAAHQRDAEWFADWFTRIGFNEKSSVHLRKMHYQLVSQKPLPMTPAGKPYQNTLECWSYLKLASKAARYLDKVDAELFSDHRNPDPHLHTLTLENQSSYLSWYCDDWTLPSIDYDLADEVDFRLPWANVNGYGYRDDLQPFHLECWIEKSTMDDVLLPICKRYRMNLVTSIGFQSMSSSISLLRRLETLQKPARVFYISDFDPAGAFMPDAVARQLEYWRIRLDIPQEVKLQPLALTREQVKEYQLPSIPIKEKDARKANFETRYGMEATELDALEAIHPGKLAQMLEQAIQPYWDESLIERMNDAKEEAEQIAYEARKWVVADHQQELANIRKGVKAELTAVREELADMNDRLQQKLAPYEKRLEAVRQGIQNNCECVPDVFELPDVPAAELEPPNESLWLFDSSRDYLAQLAVYKQRRSLSGNAGDGDDDDES